MRGSLFLDTKGRYSVRGAYSQGLESAVALAWILQTRWTFGMGIGMGIGMRIGMEGSMENSLVTR